MATDLSHIPGQVRLEQCPRCDYSLKGLPESHRCPECGFAYDDRTFVISGITRGTSGMGTGRKWLWVLVAFAATFMPSFLPILLLSGADAAVGLAAALGFVAVLAYLLLTGKRERRGIDRFIFAAGGFGHCANLTPVGVEDAKITPWSSVDRVLVSRISSNWHRLRIGVGASRPGRFSRVNLDIGIRCSEQTAAWISEVLNERLAAAVDTTATPPAW